MKKVILSTLLATLILFLWSGISPLLPWGISATQNINVQTDKSSVQAQGPNMMHKEVNDLTTDAFDAQFVNKISTYVTDKSTSWIITQPIKTDYSGYFIKEGITQLVIGFSLTILLLLTAKLDLRTRLIIIAIVGLSAVAGTYGQLMNWWQLPLSYGVGVGFNLIVGWLLTGYVIAKFLIKSEK